MKNSGKSPPKSTINLEIQRIQKSENGENNNNKLINKGRCQGQSPERKTRITNHSWQILQGQDPIVETILEQRLPRSRPDCRTILENYENIMESRIIISGLHPDASPPIIRLKD